MVISKFKEILEQQQNIQQLEITELKVVLEKFPYFQAARSLHLKGLKNIESYKYNNDLKITAAYTKDRTVLFNYITAKNFNSKKEDIHQQISKKITTETIEENQPKNTNVHILKPSVDKPAEQIKEINRAEKELKIGAPISFSSSENYSFSQWLQLSAKKPIIREAKHKIIKPSYKEELIDQFIENNPKIKPLAKDKTIVVSIEKNKQDSLLMTETLAKVYLEQKKYENAIQAYRILSLKYPEKSGYFADQIKRIQILQKNK